MERRASTDRGSYQKEGYVRKRAPEDARCWFPWNKRYLKQIGDDLYYFDDQEASSNSKSGKMIDLQGCVDVKVEEPIGNYHYLFSIQTSREWSSKGRKFLINASDNEDRKNWIECIKMALKIKNQDSTAEDSRVIRSNTVVSTDSGSASLSEVSSADVTIYEEGLRGLNGAKEYQECKADDSSVKRRNTTTSADSAVGSLHEESLQTYNNATKCEEKIKGSDGIKQPIENDECLKDTPEGRLSANDINDMPPQTRPRFNEVITNGSIVCPHCTKQFYLRGQISQEAKKKPSERDLRNVSNCKAAEHTDCARENKKCIQ